MAAAARHCHLAADVYCGWPTPFAVATLRREVSIGKPAIVAFQAPSEGGAALPSAASNDGHYAVVRGLDETCIYLMDPATSDGSRCLRIRPEFVNSWHEKTTADGRVQEYVHLTIVLYPGSRVTWNVYAPNDGRGSI